MYITNVSELVTQLRQKLPDYLEKHLKIDLSNYRTPFCCFNHEDKSPSVYLNPKTNYETAVCFSNCGTFDIFRAASIIEGLPNTGPEFITVTLPALAEQFSLEIQVGELSPQDKEKAKLYRLAEHMTHILETTTGADEYIKERGWSKSKLTIGQISAEELISKLTGLGWSSTDILSSLLIRSTTHDFVSNKHVTFAIKDHKGRTIGFVSRNTGDSGIKYVNSIESLIYSKRRSLLGIDVAIKDGEARKKGVYIVEGPGDLAALHRVGIYNAVAVCGAVFTSEHLSLLRSIGIKQAFFCLDWDDAGASGTERILMSEVKFAPGISCFVVSGPEKAKDPSEFLLGIDSSTPFSDLPHVPAFDWILQRFSGTLTAENLCAAMIPIIASEPTAIRRETLSKTLSEFTGLTYESVHYDVEAIRNNKEQERQSRINASVQKYTRGVSTDPASAPSLLSSHMQELSDINKEYKKVSSGPTYQTNRFDLLEEEKLNSSNVDNSNFVFGWNTRFASILSGGLPSTDGCLIYVGGDSNSGKTACVINIGIDVAIYDPDAIVIMHLTDDNYKQILPRLITNVASMISPEDSAPLYIGQASSPRTLITDKDTLEVYNNATSYLRGLLETEKLIIIDSEDGRTLAPLEEQLKHVRTRYPNKKLLVICDNTHNYMDFPNLENKTARIEAIANKQNEIVTNYHCCMIATVEHIKARKNTESTSMCYPVVEDIADSRALIYLAKIIIQVYQDLHVRGENATSYWIDPETGKKEPQVFLLINKNKLTSAKSPEDTLVMNIDKRRVVAYEVDAKEAREAAQSRADVANASQAEDKTPKTKLKKAPRDIQYQVEAID